MNHTGKGNKKKDGRNLSNKEKNLRQFPTRIHANDYDRLKHKLLSDNLKVQGFVEACVYAYLDGDEHIKKIAVNFKTLNKVNKKTTSWSRREQESIFDDIESLDGLNEDE